MVKTLHDYEEAAKSTAVTIGVEHLAFGLFEEAGEVAAILKRITRGDDGYTLDGLILSPFVADNMSPEAKVKLVKELGDLLWYLTTFARSIGSSLEEVANLNAEKLQDRKKRNVIKGAGDDR